jgi:hypothetical protein
MEVASHVEKDQSITDPTIREILRGVARPRMIPSRVYRRNRNPVKGILIRSNPNIRNTRCRIVDLSNHTSS